MRTTGTDNHGLAILRWNRAFSFDSFLGRLSREDQDIRNPGHEIIHQY